MMDINVALLTEENHSECSDLMKLSALQTLAAAYREMVTLRPMDEAPIGRSILIWRADNKCFYMANIDKATGELVFWGSVHDTVYFTPIGWLPLPEVTECDS